MNVRPLGQTGLVVGAVGLGTVALGRTAGLKLASPPRMPTDDEALALLAAAHRAGGNLIDTSPAYGSSEARLGVLLPRVAPRGEWVICTKVGEEFDPASGRSRYDFSPAAIAVSIDRSLSRLRVEMLDIVLLHFSGATDDAEILRRGGALAALTAAKRAGKVRAVGASTATVAGGMLAVELGCEVVMVTLNSDDRGALPVVGAAVARGVGVLVKKALGSGRLGVDSLRWALAQTGVACAVVGTTSPAHLQQAVAAAEPAG